MADDDLSGGLDYFADPFHSDPPAPDQDATWADWGRNIEATTQGILSQLNTGLRYVHEQNGNTLAAREDALAAQHYGRAQQRTIDKFSPEAKARLDAEVSDPKFWEPATLAFKTVGMTPYLAVTAIPGGLVSDGVLATLGAAGVGGALSATEYLDNVYKDLDSKSDAELMETSDYYAAKRMAGMSEEDARADYMDTLAGMKPAIAFAIGSVANAVGPGGTISRGLARTGEKSALDISEKVALKSEQHPGIVKRFGEGAAVGAASEAVDEGQTNLLTQQTRVDAGLQDEVDPGELGKAAGAGGALGALMGGPAHAAFGGTRAPRDSRKKVPGKAPVQQVDSRGPDATQAAAMAAANPPKQDTPSAAPASEPAQSAAPQPASPQAAPAPAPQAAQPNTPEAQARAASAAIDQARQGEQVTQPGNAPATAPVVARDANTVPERPETIQEQLKQLVAGQRKVVMIPEGTKWPGNPKGASFLNIPGLGRFLYNGKQVTAQQIKEAAQAGRLNDLLALGPFNKQDVAAKIQQGETPVAVTERTPAGVEVKAAAGTESTVPAQTATMEATKTPGNTVQVESPAQVVAERQAAPAAPKKETTQEKIQRLRREREAAAASTAADEARALTQEMDEARALAQEATKAPKAEAVKKTVEQRKERAKPKRMTDVEREAATAAFKTKEEPAAPVVEKAPAQEAKPFELTGEFQEVPEGVELPKGTLRKIVKGKTFARRLTESERQVTDVGKTKPTGPSLEEAEKMAPAPHKAPEAAPEKGSKGKAVKEKAAQKRPKAAQTPSKPDAKEAARLKRRAEAEQQIERLGLDRKVWTPEHIMALEDIKGGKLDDTAFADDVTDEGKPAEGAKPKRRHRSREQIQKELDDANTAKALFEDNVVNADIPGVPTTPEGRRALRMRLETLLKMAESAGIDLSKYKNIHSRTSDHILYLREAADMLETLRANEGRGHVDRVNEHIGKFYPDEYAARTKGDFGGFRERRKTEGDIKSRQYAEDATKKDHEGEELSRTVEQQADTRATPEEALSRKEDESTDTALTDEDIARLPEEARVALLEKRAAEERVRLEKAREIVGENGENAAPKSAAGKGKIVVELKGSKKSWRLATEKNNAHDPNLPPVEERGDTLYADEYYGEGTVSDMANSSFIPPDMMGGEFTKLHQMILSKIIRRMAEKVGKVKVYVVDQAFLDRVGKAQGVSGVVRGFYSGEHDAIFITHLAVQKGKMNGRLLAHEALHAMFSKALETDRELHTMVESLRSYVEDVFGDLGKAYGLTDVHEFISEAFTNPDFQAELMAAPAPDWAVQELGLGKNQKLSFWEVLTHLARRLLSETRKIIGLAPRNEATVLDAVMRLGPRLEASAEARNLMEGRDVGMRFSVADSVGDNVTDAGNRFAERTRGNAINLKGKLRHIGDALSMGHQLAQRAAAFFHGTDAPRRVMEFREMMRVAKANILDGGGHEFIRRGAELERKYKGTGEFEKAAEVAYSATINDVNLGDNADNEHLGLQPGQDRTKGWQAKARLPELQAAFKALPQDLQDWIHEGAKYFRDVQNEISLAQIKNILQVAGHDDPALAERIFTEGTNEDDRKLFKTNTLLSHLDRARNLKKINGMYFPLLRQGDYVVTAKHPLEVPPGGEKVGDDVIQFVAPTAAPGKPGNAEARRMAREYVQQAALTHVGTRKVYVDANDHTKVVPKEDANAVPAYRVTMQTQHMELHENEAEARAAADELRKAGLEVTHVGLKAQNPHAQNGDMLASQIQQLVSTMKRRKGFTRLGNAEKNELIQALNESSIRFLSGTRIQQRMLPRRKVEGYNKDLLRNSARYADMAAGYLAKLQHMPKIEQALGEMQDYIKSHGKEGDDRTIRRDELFREFENRVYRPDEIIPEAQTPTQRITRRLLQISQLDKLAGVSFHLINSTEPWTTSMPVIGGRHGFFQASRALSNAYRFIGAGDGVIAAAKDTVKAARQNTGFTNFVDMFKQNIDADKSLAPETKKRFGEVLDHLHLRGLMDNQSGLEVGRTADPSASALGRGLDRADLMARQMGQAIESINRAVTGLAAYHLEYKRNGGDHQGALQYAHDVTADTMGNYSFTNSAPIFNTTVGRLTLQFKKFGQKTYYLLGKTIRAAYHGDREAMKQFAGLMFTHGVVAGALGLPIEPFKIAVMAAGAFTGTGVTPEDFEDAIRRSLTKLTGSSKAAEIITHGLPRAAGVDLSGRLGLDNLLVFGQPTGSSKNDITAFLAQTVAGAPIGYVLDQIQAGQELFKGNYAKAVELTVPLKVVTDAMRAGEGIVTGKEDRNGRQVMDPYSAYEAGIQALGFTPSRKMESQALRGAVQRETNRQSADRRTFMNDWAAAKPGERVKLWREIQEWNRERPMEARLTRAQLDRYVKTRREESQKGRFVNGVRVTNQNRYIYKKNQVFNVD